MKTFYIVGKEEEDQQWVVEHLLEWGLAIKSPPLYFSLKMPTLKMSLQRDLILILLLTFSPLGLGVNVKNF